MTSTLWFCFIKSFMKVALKTKWTQENYLRLCCLKGFLNILKCAQQLSELDEGINTGCNKNKILN